MNERYCKKLQVELWLWGVKTKDELQKLFEDLSSGRLKLSKRNIRERRRKRELIDFLTMHKRFTTIRKLSRILQIPKTTLLRYLQELQTFGLVSVRMEGKRAVIVFNGSESEEEKTQDQKTEQEHPKVDQKGEESGTEEEPVKEPVREEDDTEVILQEIESEFGVKFIRLTWSEKGDGQTKKDRGEAKKQSEPPQKTDQSPIYINNNTPPLSINKDEKKEKNIINRGENNINNSKQHANSEKLSPSLVSLIVSNIVNEFKMKYRQRFNRFPIIDLNSKKRIEQTLLATCSTREELEEVSNAIIKRIPAFFSLQDPWVIKQRYSFFAFSFRIDQLMTLSSSVRETGEFEITGLRRIAC